MNFIADFHIHSHFSRATAKNLDLPHIYKEAQIKGITLIGTGDFTHPGWFAALSESLVPAEPGLYALKPELAKTVESQIPQSCRSPVRFILTVEISNIYKKNGRTRKNHNLLFMPDLEAVNTLNTQLDRIGNIHSDGRPILGLDAHHLLDMTLNAHERGFLIPAHIWTPWFSMLGSKSGFDTLTECFDDLSDYIFAVETGLSSDPPMNRRVSFLDHLTLVSNSDAHSPDKLGREANLFNTHLSYDAIYDAMKSGNGFDGTIEFYPEEGKYHLDGHRKCDIRFTPEESQTNNGLCPTCGKPLTLGVLYRVNELADRLEQDVDSPHFESLIPLKEILSEILQKGPKTKTVAKHYQTAIEQLGSEFHILRHCPLETIETAHIPLLAEAIKRLRSGHVHLSGGYDGEFGTVRVFEQSEIETIKGQQSLFHMGTRKQKPRQPPKNQVVKKRQFVFNEIQNDTITLNSAQQSVVSSRDHHLIIIAGPGTGKTRTITTRIASLITDHQVPPHNILAVTFTQKAAMEMKHRLLQDFNQQQSLPMVATFHALCLYILENELPESQSFRILNETEQDFCVTIARNNCVETKLPSKKQCKKWIETAKQKCLSPNDDLSSISNDLSFKTVYQGYTDVLKEYQSMDFEDILFQTIQLFQKNKAIRKKWCQQFPYIFVDEYQDINYSQYTLIQCLVNNDTHLCVIGDPDQAIYGFRGSDVSYFQRFMHDFPQGKCYYLSQNYRSTETILKVSEQVISSYSLQSGRQQIFSGLKGASQIHIFKTTTARAEADMIVKTIEQLMGGISHFSLDSGRVDATDVPDDLSFSDFAVLYRTHEIGQYVIEAFERSGIPFHTAFKKKQSLCIQGLIAILRLMAGCFRLFDLEPLLLLINPDIDKQHIKQFHQWIESSHSSFTAQQLANLPQNNLCSDNQGDWKTLITLGEQLTSELKGKTISQCIQQILTLKEFVHVSINDQSYFDRLIVLAENTGHNYSQFFSQIALFQDIDVIPEHVEKVCLLTMHASKGLEFPVVFIAGCEDNIIPFQGFGANLNDRWLNEERRLFYVAVTRAKRLLYCSYARSRQLSGKQQQQQLSPFVKHIELDLIQYQNCCDVKKPKPTNYKQQMLI